MEKTYQVIVLSVVKHAYLPDAIAAHPRFELMAVADDPDRPEWTHARNQAYADEKGIPYIQDVEQALAEQGAYRGYQFGSRTALQSGHASS